MTVAIVANIARPISSAISTAFAMDNYGKLNDYGKLGAWSPLSLFAASEVGAWYDPSDLTTMFQDSAGTTPVTADGQPVGKILDKSGRGNHASQATAARRPLYKTDGTYSWLQFDGVDDSLSTAAINFTSTDKMSVFSGLRKLSDVTLEMVVEFSPNGASNSGSFWLAAPLFSATDYDYLSKGTVGVSAKAPGYPAPVTNVLTGISSISTDMVAIRVDGAQANTSAIDQGTGNYGLYPLYIGSRGGGAMYFNGHIYSLIVRGALSTTQEITDTETWVNQRTGAY